MCLASCRFVVANSKLVKTDLIASYPHLSDKVKVIYNGVDRECFSPLEPSTSSVERKDKVFLFVGHDWGRKNLSTTLQICSLYKEKYGANFVLRVLGKGSAEHYHKAIAELDLEKEVHFLGSQSDIEQHYKEADALILPTLYDPFSNACLEALSCGCAVVTTASNGASEVILEGTTGHVLQDPTLISNELLDFLHAQLSRAAIAKSVESHCRKMEMDQLASLVQQVACEKGLIFNQSANPPAVH